MFLRNVGHLVLIYECRKHHGVELLYNIKWIKYYVNERISNVFRNFTVLFMVCMLGIFE